MEYCCHIREGIIVNTGVRLPSLRQVMIWLFTITVISFAIGGSIDMIDGGKYGNKTPDEESPLDVPSDNLTNAIVSLEMDTGNIILTQGDSEHLINGTICGPRLKEKPHQDFWVSEKTGHLSLKQEPYSLSHTFSHYENWSLSLNPEIPVALSVISGAGNINITPGEVKLSGLTVEMGTGDLDIDLSGWKGGHLPVLISGGLGSMSIILPNNTSIASSIETGIGSRTISGLEGGDGIYYLSMQNPHASVISLSVAQGVGDLTIGVAS